VIRGDTCGAESSRSTSIRTVFARVDDDCAGEDLLVVSGPFGETMADIAVGQESASVVGVVDYRYLEPWDLWGLGLGQVTDVCHILDNRCGHPAAGMDSKARKPPTGGSTMTAQPADRIPASGPDTGSYEVIHLGGQAALVVPVSDFMRLRALEEVASPQELEDAEDRQRWRTGVPGRPPGRPHTYRTTRRCGGSAWPGEPPGYLGGSGDRPGGRVPPGRP
jgi:hypothetical protein